jgi:KDO2-lipid IV(A) lauroyltransferase
MVSSLGALIGSMAKYRFRQADKDARANLKLLLPGISDDQIRTRSNEMWCNIGRTLTEMAVLDRFDIKHHVKVINEEVLQGIDRNKPVIFLYPHLGNWEVLALLIVSLGFRLNILYESLPNRFQRRLLENTRRRSGYELISPDHQGIKQMYRALAAGESIGMAMDEFKHGRIISLNFNGRSDENSNMRYAVKMARRFGADIVTGYCKRESKSKLSFDIIVSDHLCITETPFKNKSDAEIADYINDRCRRWIIDHADQWYMLHRARISKPADTN